MDLTRHRAGRLDPTVQGLLWSVAAGLCFVLLNTMTRYLTTQIPPLQSQFLRYLCGVIVLLPLVLRSGMAAWMPQNIRGQFVRGFVHTTGLAIWFTAIPHISLADTTAIGFTTPIFIMLGAWIFLREPMRWERWLAALLGFGGVLIVVGPGLTASGGYYSLVMLSSAPMFAASFLISKALTRYESAGVIVLWQSITVTILSLPLALLNWQPVSAAQWAGYMLCGLLGSGAHYLLMRSYAVAEISATQSVKFLDLVWAALLGWLVFADVPTSHSLIGGTIIAGATLWIARREARRGT
ncbi:DMT family transporter [Rhodoferax sp. BAB1]|uniref:DMT family transporter n=1 Tax=Rhodoferax sp. BAB1 TaxID=2741720 RepID=UPI001575EC3C|nr:DMT family transporter [Rhodoferax sp. BAB1]QKO21812.1 DMT family transporter [Rhodoferax sp. BAB1]